MRERGAPRKAPAQSLRPESKNTRRESGRGTDPDGEELSERNGRQDDKKERIDSADEEELIRVAKEPGKLGKKADKGKTFTESDVRSLLKRQATSVKDRLFQRRS